MTPIPTEITIACGECNAIYSEQRIIIKVQDASGGPYLSIEGFDDEPLDDNEKHCFYLCNNKDIDQFSKICKKLLKDAENAYAGGK